MLKKTVLAFLMASVVPLAAASARDLVIVSNGGTFQEAQHNAIFVPYQ